MRFKQVAYCVQRMNLSCWMMKIIFHLPCEPLSLSPKSISFTMNTPKNKLMISCSFGRRTNGNEEKGKLICGLVNFSNSKMIVFPEIRASMSMLAWFAWRIESYVCMEN